MSPLTMYKSDIEKNVSLGVPHEQKHPLNSQGNQFFTLLKVEVVGWRPFSKNE